MLIKRMPTAPLAAAALAMGLGLGLLSVTAPAVARGDSAPASSADPTTLKLQDPQPDVAGGGVVGTFPPLDVVALETAGQPPPLGESLAALRARELSDNQTPIAPLPPAIVAGPVSLALATFLAIRANRRGGRI